MSIPLFAKLQAYNFGTIGTIRLYIEFSKGLKELKAQFLIKLKWNTLFITVVQDVLCLT
jgi:hypothetical protein